MHDIWSRMMIQKVLRREQMEGKLSMGNYPGEMSWECVQGKCADVLQPVITLIGWCDCHIVHSSCWNLWCRYKWKRIIIIIIIIIIYFVLHTNFFELICLRIRLHWKNDDDDEQSLVFFVSCIFMSCNFMSCGLVCHFHALWFGPWFSCLAFSGPAFSAHPNKYRVVLV